MLRANQELIGPYIIWGDQVFLKKDMSGHSLSATVRDQEFQLKLTDAIPLNTSSHREIGQLCSILVKAVQLHFPCTRENNSLNSTSQSLEKYNFKQHKRFICDLSKSIDVPQFHMRLIPGFITTIAEFHVHSSPFYEGRMTTH